MESSERSRFLIPSVVVGVIVIVVLGGLFLGSRSAEAKGKTTQASVAPAKGKDAKEQKEKDKEKPPVPVDVASAGFAPISSYISGTANLVAENSVRVLAESEGRIAQLLVDEGSTVRKGQTLAILVRDDAEIALSKAKVRLDNARVTYRRAKEMSENGLMAAVDYDKAFLDRRVAEQEVAEAQWRLEKTVIKAPFGGRITERLVSAGQHVRSGEALFGVADFDRLVAYIFLPERDALELTGGREVRLKLRANESIAFAGRIRQLSPVVDTATGTVRLTIDAINTPEAARRPGAFINVEIPRHTKPHALVVPREAILREMRQTSIFVLEGDIARKRDVTLGIEENGKVEVLEGVRDGERVIVAGQGSLKDGATVKVIGAPAA
jgi:membrane fusion protein, multidrug efflux system